MGKFLIAKKTNRIKLLTKTAKKFSCSPVKIVLALAEGQIISNSIKKNITWYILTILLSLYFLNWISDYLTLGKSKYYFRWWTSEFSRSFRQEFDLICFLGNQKFPHFHTLEIYYETRLFRNCPNRREKDPLKIIADVS